MKAADFNKAIRKREDYLTIKFTRAVNEALNSLSEETGLDIDDINLRIEEMTSTGDASKKYELVRVNIYASLPSHY